MKRAARLNRLALGLALLGYWAPWLAHPAATLQINGFELSEWITFLPEARDGSLRVTRLDFLIPLACLALLLGLASRAGAPHPGGWLWPRLPASPLGWGLLTLALLCCAALFPPYPYILTAYREPEFQLQFFLACVLPGALLLTLYLPAELNPLAQIPLALLGGVYGAWTFLTVRPIFIALLNAPWATGLGWFTMLFGFAWLALLAGGSLFSAEAERD